MSDVDSQHEVDSFSAMGQFKSTASRVMLPKRGSTDLFSLEVLRGPCPHPWYGFTNDESEIALSSQLQRVTAASLCQRPTPQRHAGTLEGRWG